jgi:hypothetical protein
MSLLDKHVPHRRDKLVNLVSQLSVRLLHISSPTLSSEAWLETNGNHG